MAMDDFDPAPDEKREGEDLVEAGLDEDQDLFDFPPVDWEAPEEAPGPDAILDEPEPDEPEVPDAAPGALAAPDAATNADLDEDIFDFPPLDQLDPVPMTGGSEDGISLDAFDDIEDLMVGTDIDDDMRSLMEDDDPHVEVDDVVVPAAQAAAEITAPAAPQVVQAAGLSKRSLWLLVGSSLCANLLLFAFAWQVSAALRESVEGVQHTIVQTGDRLRVDLASQAPAPAQPAPAPGGAQLEDIDVMQVRIAREEMAAGRFADARRRLHRLMALADGMASQQREEVEAEAAYLIAEAYRREAAALNPEDAP